MSNQAIVEKAREGKTLSKEDLLYLAQREQVAGVPKITEVVDLEEVGGEQVLQDALYSNEGFPAAEKKAKAKKTKEPSKAEVEKKAKKSKESPDPEDTTGYADEGTRGGAKVADTLGKGPGGDAADDD